MDEDLMEGRGSAEFEDLDQLRDAMANLNEKLDIV